MVIPDVKLVILPTAPAAKVWMPVVIDEAKSAPGNEGKLMLTGLDEPNEGVEPVDIGVWVAVEPRKVGSKFPHHIGKKTGP